MRSPPEKRGGRAVALPQAGESIHDGLRRTGGAAISFAAFSTSFAASCVASIASSRFVLVRFAFRAIHGQALKVGQKFLDARLQRLHAVANVLLFFDSDVDQVGGIVDAARVAVDQAVQAIGPFLVRRVDVREFILKFLDAVRGEARIKHDARARRARFANLVGFRFGQIIFLLGRGVGRAGGRSAQDRSEQQQAPGLGDGSHGTPHGSDFGELRSGLRGKSSSMSSF